MNNNIKYSVLMSVYKKENPKYLELSINSMINQTIRPNEIVIVKDGPLTDDLELIISEYMYTHPNLFKIVKIENNVGLGKALNLGLDICRNELIARMDCDDISLPERCEKQIKEFQLDESLDIIGTFIDEFYDDPQKIISSRTVPVNHNEIYEFSKRRSAFNHPTVMYKKSKVIENGGYSDLRRNQDVDLFGRMLFNGCKSKNLNESLLLFRTNDDLAKRRKSWENTKSYIETIKKLWKIGYSSYWDYLLIMIVQTGMFICPISIQHWIYKKFLRS